MNGIKAGLRFSAAISRVLLSMLREIPDYPDLKTGLAVDVGCSVGGMAYLLAAEFGFVYGLDCSFTTVLNARRIVLQSPVPQTSYNLKLDVGTWSDGIPLNLAKRTNVEFLVASTSALPFQSETIDCVTSLNVIDVLQQPQELLTEVARILNAGKPFVLSDPYCWKKQGGQEVKESSVDCPGTCAQVCRSVALLSRARRPVRGCCDCMIAVGTFTFVSVG